MILLEKLCLIRLKVNLKDWKIQIGIEELVQGIRIVYFVKDDAIFITKIGLRKNVYKIDVGCPKFSKKKLRSL